MIKVKNLTFHYSGRKEKAVNNVNFHIPRGKYVAIVGHNGSGKSTLSKLLVGLFKPSSGSVVINDVEISKKNLRKIRSLIGIVFQNPDNQFVGATVEDDIAFGLENKKLQRTKMKDVILELSEKVGMTQYLEREPQYLSGGQKQRVAIASVLALNPEVIIFDEVTSMLDPAGKRTVLELISNIQKNENKTLLSITHDMDEALLADLVFVMAGGKMIAFGEPEVVLTDEEIIRRAKIDSPFIYRISKQLFGEDKSKITFSKKTLVEELCKLK